VRRERPRHKAPPPRHTARASHPIRAFTLQRAAGNRATAQLLQREPSKAARLAKIAKQLGMNVEERDVHLALRVKAGEDHGVRPGLNIVANLPTRGRTGFVESGGRYHGDFLTATRDGELPAVAIMLGPQAFQDGDDAVLATLRHELTHAEHDRTILAWLTKWRTAGHGRLITWMQKQKASPGDLALVDAGTHANRTNTELLAHIEGFAAAFEKTPPPRASAVRKSTLPLAIEELRGGAEHGWTGVDPAVKTLAEKRLAEFYRGLDANRQALLRDWLFYLRYRATTPWPKDATDDDAKAARLVRNLFQPYVPFLEWLLNVLANIEFAAHALPHPANVRPVDNITRKAPTRTVKIGAGKVTACADVGFRFAGDSHAHGVSLSYEGPDASEMRWLQFIWREVTTDQGQPISGTLYHQGQDYPLTTNPSEPSQIGWNTDTATYLGGPDSAFYEKDNATNRTAGRLEMFDEPSAPSVTAAHAPGVSRAHLIQYLVKGRTVLFRTEFEIEHGSSQPGAKPRLVSAQPAAAIDPGPRARLHAQFKDLDYLP
jgi:hypothetical protein